MEEYEEINMDGYEEAKALMDKIGAKSEEILKRENKFLATQARAREALAANQRIQKRNFAQSQEPLIRIKEDLEAQLNNNPFYKQLDDKSVYIRLGDFKQEIIDYLGISNIDVFLFTDLDWIEGSYTPEELKNLLKSSDRT